MRRAGRTWGSWAARRALLAICLLLVMVRAVPVMASPTFQDRAPTIPDAAHPGPEGRHYVDLPPGYWASLYQSPTDGGLLAEWFGGAAMDALGLRFDDGRARWLLVRDPAGNEGWIGEIFLGEQPPADAPPAEDEAYLSAVTWNGEIVICANPASAPPGLEGEQFVRLVRVAVDRWQQVTDDILPLRAEGRCDADPGERADGVNTVGWTTDLGLIVAGLAWPNADSGTVSEVDIQLSRGYFERLAEQRPQKTMRACVLSTLVHELGHLIGLNHPRSRLLPSSMQAVGASRCDKAMPTAQDRAQLLRRYGPDAAR